MKRRCLKTGGALTLAALLPSIAGCVSHGIVPPNTGAVSNDAAYVQPSWKVTQIASGFGGPLAVDTDSNVYVVADNNTNEVKKIQPDGDVTQLGHGFLGPAGVAVYNGNVYVADAGHDAIKKVGKGGTISVAVKLKNPASITVDKQGIIYAVELDVCKSAYVCISKITPNEKTTTLLTTAFNVDNITLDSATNLYVAAYSFGRYGCCATGRIYKITPSGQVSTREFKSLASESVAVDGDSNIYVGAIRSWFKGAAIYKITPSGTMTAIVHFGERDSIVDGLALRNGVLYAGVAETDHANSAVYKITP